MSCQHIYCMECIYEWVRYTNACPLCKVTIRQLKIFDDIEPEEVDQLLDVPEPKQARGADGELLDNEINFAEVCYICQAQKTPDEEEAMLVCDNCDFQTAHHQCLNMSVIPEGDWYCHPCTKERAEMARKEKQQRKILKLSQFRK